MRRANSSARAPIRCVIQVWRSKVSCGREPSRPLNQCHVRGRTEPRIGT
jgi:hypothetical protein